MGLDEDAGKNSIIIIKEISYLTKSDGGKVKRLTEIGRLKVIEWQGEVILCKVVTGEKVLEDKMKAPSSLEFFIE
jgi:hypothetical protein